MAAAVSNALSTQEDDLMKNLATAAIVLALAGTALGAMYITQNCALTTGNLNELKFEQQPNESKMIGGPQSFKVTKGTIDYLEQLMKDNKTIEVQNDGGIKIK
jgi:hypothetical protein